MVVGGRHKEGSEAVTQPNPTSTVHWLLQPSPLMVLLSSQV
jgi:hypothetical protein